MDQHARRTGWLTARLRTVPGLAADDSRDAAIAPSTHEAGKPDAPSKPLAKPGALATDTRAASALGGWRTRKNVAELIHGIAGQM